MIATGTPVSSENLASRSPPQGAGRSAATRAGIRSSRPPRPRHGRHKRRRWRDRRSHFGFAAARSLPIMPQHRVAGLIGRDRDEHVVCFSKSVEEWLSPLPRGGEVPTLPLRGAEAEQRGWQEGRHRKEPASLRRLDLAQLLRDRASCPRPPPAAAACAPTTARAE